MKLTTGAEIQKDIIIDDIKKIINQTYKLLPNWEEAIDWETPLKTIIEELSGMDKLLIEYHNILFPLLCKLQGLFIFQKEEDYLDYRRCIFECLNLLTSLKEEVSLCQD